MKNVDEFYNKAKTYNQPSNLLKAFFNMNFNKDFKEKIAIDLGAGVGNDAKFLINRGFNVTCVDKEEKSKKEILNKIENNEKLNFIISDFEEVKLHKADLIYSCSSLHLCNPSKFDDFMEEITQNVIPGGFFVRKFSWRR